MNEANLPATEPVTDEDYAAACATAFFLGLRPVLEQDRRRVAERQAPEIERLRAEVAQADADYNDAVTLAQMNLDLLKAVEAEVAALKEQSVMAATDSFTRILEVLAGAELRLRDAAHRVRRPLRRQALGAPARRLRHRARHLVLDEELPHLHRGQ